MPDKHDARTDYVLELAQQSLVTASPLPNSKVDAFAPLSSHILHVTEAELSQCTTVLSVTTPALADIASGTYKTDDQNDTIMGLHHHGVTLLVGVCRRA